MSLSDLATANVTLHEPAPFVLASLNILTLGTAEHTFEEYPHKKNLGKKA